MPCYPRHDIINEGSPSLFSENTAVENASLSRFVNLCACSSGDSGKPLLAICLLIYLDCEGSYFL